MSRKKRSKEAVGYLVDVPAPFLLTYVGKPWPHPIKFHRKCADRFADAFARVWTAAGRNPMSPVLRRISRFSGSYNDRNVRGSTRKSGIMAQTPQAN